MRQLSVSAGDVLHRDGFITMFNFDIVLYVYDTRRAVIVYDGATHRVIGLPLNYYEATGWKVLR